MEQSDESQEVAKSLSNLARQDHDESKDSIDICSSIPSSSDNEVHQHEQLSGSGPSDRSLRMVHEQLSILANLLQQLSSQGRKDIRKVVHIDTRHGNARAKRVPLQLQDSGDSDSLDGFIDDTGEL